MPTPRTYPDPLLVDRYLTNTATAADRAELATQLGIDATQLDAQRVRSALQATGDGITEQIRIIDREALLRRIGGLGAELYDGPLRPGAPKHGVPQLRIQSLRRGALGLGALALVASAVIIWSPWSTSMQPTQSIRTYATSIGQRARVTLDDGTTVTLAPQTTLRLTAFNAHTRIVSLDGDAYFHVTHAAGRPFTVATGAVRTQVLGTSFDITHDLRRAEVRVVVVDGKVVVHGSRALRSSITATAGTLVRVTDSSATTTAIPNVNDYTSWVNGPLVFHGATVADMLSAVGRWYGYQFRLSDSTLAQRHVDFEVNYSSAAVTLRAIQMLLDVQMTYNGTVVTLHPKFRPSSPAPTRRPFLPSPFSIPEYGR